MGVFFLPTRNESDKAEMHFIINDEDQGPSTKNIPYKEGTLLHAVVDVYGTTKQVKIIQLYGGSKFILYFNQRASKFILFFFSIKLTVCMSRRNFNSNTKISHIPITVTK